MQMTGNTILITGGGSGIGRGFAEAFHKLGNTVIIAGRDQKKLDDTTRENPGVEAMTLDTSSGESVAKFAREITAKFPALNVVLHSAGIMKTENLKAGGNARTQHDTIATNLLGVLQLTEALLPSLLKQKSGAVVTVSSGLAFVPLAMTPTYSATKAAIHSWSQSLRYQLKGTGIQVIEIAPPYVQTGLMGEHQHTDPNAMPLDEYIAESMQILKDNPDTREVLVGRVLPLRFSAESKEGHEKYVAFFDQFNDTLQKQRPS